VQIQRGQRRTKQSRVSGGLHPVCSYDARNPHGAKGHGSLGMGRRSPAISRHGSGADGGARDRRLGRGSIARGQMVWTGPRWASVRSMPANPALDEGIVSLLPKDRGWSLQSPEAGTVSLRSSPYPPFPTCIVNESERRSARPIACTSPVQPGSPDGRQ
jgi:hypothetical protein